MAEIVAASAVTEAGVSKRVALKRIRTGSSGDPSSWRGSSTRSGWRCSCRTRTSCRCSTSAAPRGTSTFWRWSSSRASTCSGCGGGPRRAAAARGGAAHGRADAARARLRPPPHRQRDRPLGIVHLDVKPANVLVSFEGEVKLTDFGVARSRDVRRPIEGISGTNPFMSPEQTRGEPVDLRSDVFSAGVVLYTLLAGECPFGEEDTGETLAEIQLCRIGRRRASSARAVRALLRRALARRARDRLPARARSPTRSTS